MAVSGLLEESQPGKRKGGIAGWVGERQASPTFQKLQTLLQTPVQTTETVPGPPTLGSRQTAQGLPPVEGVAPPEQPQTMLQNAPQNAPAAMPDTQTTRPGAPPPTPQSVVQSPPEPTSIIRQAMKPRQALLTQPQQVEQDAAGRAMGEITGMRTALRAAMPQASDQEIGDIIKQHIARRYGAGLPYTKIPLEVPDGQGGYTQIMGTYDRSSGTYLDDSLQPVYGARPLQHTGSTTMGKDVEMFANIMYGKRGVDLNSLQASKVQRMLDLRKQQLTREQALNHAEREFPEGTVEQKQRLADYMFQSSAAPEAAPAGGSTPPPAPTQPGAPPASPDATAAPPTTPPPAPGGGKPTLPPDLNVTRNTGKPLPAAISNTVAKAKSTNDLIDQALKALEPFKNDNTLEGSVKLTEAYRHGQYTPVASAAAQLADLAGLQSSSQSQLTGGSSRAMRFYVDRRQHVPRLPSGRQAMASHVIGATGSERVSEAIKGDEGGFDTPQMMYQKLLQAKENNQNYIREIEASTGPGATTGAPPSPSQPYKDKNGKWQLPD